MRRLLTTPSWLFRHVLALVLVVGFARMGWWQLSRFESSSGDWQNLGYALQWPLFALFVAYFWWRLVRDELHVVRPAPTPRRRRDPAPQRTADALPTEEFDEKAAAYNRYLRYLNQQESDR